MSVKIILFGQLKDLAGTSSITLNEVNDLDSLKKKLLSDYPSLASSIYRIAVDRNFIEGNVALSDNNEIALLPPYSGG